MGPVFFFQPFLSQVGAHLVKTLIQNSESVWISTDSFWSMAYLIASLMAVPSMRILVVWSALPVRIGDLVFASMIAQPPGPGLGSALPSVQRIFMLPHDGKFVFAFFDDGDLIDIDFFVNFGAVNRDGMTGDEFASFLFGLGETGID